MSGRRAQKGQKNQALGRSRGGLPTKIHLKTDRDGHPIAFDLTGGEKGDCPHSGSEDAATIMDAFPDGRYKEALEDAAAYAACLQKYGKV
jgi:hypothetical protein